MTNENDKKPDDYHPKNGNWNSAATFLSELKALRRRTQLAVNHKFWRAPALCHPNRTTDTDANVG